MRNTALYLFIFFAHTFYLPPPHCTWLINEPKVNWVWHCFIFLFINLFIGIKYKVCQSQRGFSLVFLPNYNVAEKLQFHSLEKKKN